MAGYYGKDQCNMFVRVSNFEALKPGWQLDHLVGTKDADPTSVQGALGNETTPLYVYERFVPSPVETPPAKVVGPKLTMDWLVEQTLWSVADLEELMEAIRRQGQVILAGPPGTGKTWVAERVARYLTQNEPLQTRIVQFHPSYGYEEFVEGVRPVAKDGAISFERRDGVILELANAMIDTDATRVLIIDEINRANIPRVFGELLYLLEYRNSSIRLQYSEEFELPDNLKIIATMNTADRSIRSIDVALRRRFEIFECPADPAVLGRYYKSRATTVPDLVDGFAKLNDALSEQLDRHHTIGQSFFMADGYDHDRLSRAWKRQILPLIEDYFFDQPDVVKQFASPHAFWNPAGF
jgi:5-methylcytosine-specific restriction protein B